MPQDPQLMPLDNAMPDSFESGKSMQTHDALPGVLQAPGEYFCGNVFVIDDRQPGGDLDDIDEFHDQPMHTASQATFDPAWLSTLPLAPGFPLIPGDVFSRDLFIIDLNDIGDCDDFDDLPATARPNMAPIASAAGGRPGFLAPLFQTEMPPSPVYFPDQPEGYVFDVPVTDETYKWWAVLPRDVFWLAMGRAPTAEIVFE